MKMSRRAKRMQRHHKRNRGRGGINLVSLMDIFTILVFFLLVNSSEVQVLPNAKALKLPESSAEQRAKETMVVMLNAEEIRLQGEIVVQLDRLGDSTTEMIEPLRQALDERVKTVLPTAGKDAGGTGEITIMADRQVPYSLLKRVMLTCAESEFGNISLAVVRRPEEGESEVAL
ncbi:MAG: biopolymer transporter ExbD [gamma proteobacterium endosymbiont of Lamellibrachia anaximandri]|nr:biopolymer transporter ExbD [gamma proteobacterium endosymbiont of Lamellibrachia anaximandri]